MIVDFAALHPIETAIIYRYRRQVKAILPFILIIVEVEIGLFLLYNFANNLSRSWTTEGGGWSTHDCLMLILTFLFTGYGVLSNFFFVFYFVLVTTKYVRLKQRARLARLVEVESAMLKRINSKINPTTFRAEERLDGLWRRFQQCNSAISALYDEIRGLNCFWSRLISAYFVVYSAESCYLFYTYFFVPISTTFLEYILISVAVNFVAILLYVTLQCSKLVYRNCKAARQAERIGKRFSMEQSLAQFGVLNRLKVDLAAANYEAVLETVAFRLATGHQVNSRMFQLLFTYVSLLFMMVFKNNQNIQ